ncbi:MAG: SUMF1/EgtB/PvdO family nonheme iron enzyme [Planctomycetota bacterium]
MNRSFKNWRRAVTVNGSLHSTPNSNPFPGLRPYQEGEEYLFFGRENQVDGMIDKLSPTRFLAVVGASGSGKSSLVNCGLRPALRAGMMAGAGTDWRIAQFRPGSDPIAAMTAALSKEDLLFSGFESRGMSLFDIVGTTLRMSRLGIVDLFQQAPINDDTNLLLVVDQFEELFRYRRLAAGRKTGQFGISEDATAFVNLLLAARVHSERIHVVITMRSDFLGDCPQFVGLAEAINDGQYLVPRLTRDERRLAITGPVRVGRGEISPMLVTRLVNDVGDNPDQLSILQHALNRTWHHWAEGPKDGPIDFEHYERIGTMEGALDQHANDAFDLLAEEQQYLCKKLFQVLTDTASDSRGVRRPTKLGPLRENQKPQASICDLIDAPPDQIEEIINVFRASSRSFLMPPTNEELGPESVVDISHESLMRVWKRLRGWADEEARSAQMYRRLVQTAELYKQNKAALWTDPDLRLALAWRGEQQPTRDWAERYEPGFENAMTFLDESRDARTLARWRLFGYITMAIAVMGMFYSFMRSDRLNAETDRGVKNLVNARPEAVPYVIESLKPIRSRALPDLRRFANGESLSKKVNASCALAELDDLTPQLHSQLIDLVARTEGIHSQNLIHALAHQPRMSRESLRARLEQEKDLNLRVRWAVALLCLGEDEHAAEMLAAGESSGNPLERTAFIREYAEWPGDLRIVMENSVAKQLSPSLRSGLLLSLAGVNLRSFSRVDLDDFLPKWRGLYQDPKSIASDSASHSALRFLLSALNSRIPSVEPSLDSIAERDWFVDSMNITFLRVPSGTYKIGEMDEGESLETDGQTIDIDGSLFLSDCETTYGQFRAFVNSAAQDRPKDWKDDTSIPDDYPVDNVRYEDGLRFCNWLSAKANLKPYYINDGDEWLQNTSSQGYRLPTSKEWEAACRAGTITRFATGDDPYDLNDYAIVNHAQLSPCRTKLPNGWGFFDMHGGVAEMCDATKDWPDVPSRGGHRQHILEDYEGIGLTSFSSNLVDQAPRDLVGFRVARNVP